MYVAVNVATGKIAWERCAIGQIGLANRTLTTVTPVADCAKSNGVLPATSTSTCGVNSITAPPSVSNGVLIVSGISNYQDNALPSLLLPFGEVLLLNASNGQLLRELPMGLLGQPAGNPTIYTRAFAVGKSLYMASGLYFPAYGSNPKAPFYRVVEYNLSNDNDNYYDDSDQDVIQEDINS